MNYYIINNAIIGFPEPLAQDLYDYTQLTTEQSAFFELHNCSAQEAIDMQLIVTPLEDLKAELLSENTRFASQLLGLTDYRIIRHSEQIAAGTARTLTDEEFNALAAERKAIRDLCNEYERLINEATNEYELPVLNYNQN